MTTAHFSKCNNQSVWVTGHCEGHLFEAMLMDIDCEQGIMKGRVLELQISCIAEYRFGWIIEPDQSKKPIFNAVMRLLQDAPKRFY